MRGPGAALCSRGVDQSADLDVVGIIDANEVSDQPFGMDVCSDAREHLREVYQHAGHVFVIRCESAERGAGQFAHENPFVVIVVVVVGVSRVRYHSGHGDFWTAVLNETQAGDFVQRFGSRPEAPADFEDELFLFFFFFFFFPQRGWRRGGNAVIAADADADADGVDSIVVG